MGLYKKEVFKKDNKGNWKKISSSVEKAPHDVGRWNRSVELEKRSNEGEKTYFNVGSTRGELNEKVVSARTYFGNNEKVVRTLITTSNKLPKTKKR